MSAKKSIITHVTKGDVLQDLGFSAEESASLRARGNVLAEIQRHVKARRRTQKQLAELLQMHQPDVSNLLAGRVDRFSLDRLVDIATRLGLRLTFSVEKITDTNRLRRKAA